MSSQARKQAELRRQLEADRPGRCDPQAVARGRDYVRALALEQGREDARAGRPRRWSTVGAAFARVYLHGYDLEVSRAFDARAGEGIQEGAA